MELRQLRWLLATVEAGSISAAARDGHISQPALSVAISQLERELRTPLLVRSRDGVCPTAAGTAVLGIARRMMRDADLAATISRAGVEHPRRLRVAMVDLNGVPPLAAGVVAASAAGIEVEFMWRHRPWDTDPLLADDCDVAVLAAPVTGPGIRTAVLHIEPRGILVGPSSELFEATSDDLTFEEIARHPSVDAVGMPRAWVEEWAYAGWMNGQPVRRVGPEVDSVNATLISVMTTPAMAFVPQGLGLVGRRFGLRYLDVAHGPPCTHLLAWREPADAATRLFLDAVVDGMDA